MGVQYLVYLLPFRIWPWKWEVQPYRVVTRLQSRPRFWFCCTGRHFSTPGQALGCLHRAVCKLSADIVKLQLSHTRTYIEIPAWLIRRAQKPSGDRDVPPSNPPYHDLTVP